jgi:glycosyltransferase involved in cell wall biosynthesis
MELRFAVIQLGARLHYAVPAVLERAGMLQMLYTDAYADSPAFGPLRMLPSALQPRGVRRLLSRRVPAAISPAKVRSWIRPSFQIEWLNRRKPQRRKESRYWHDRQAGGHWLAQRAIADNFRGANALYVHPCVSTDAVREAKKRGMFVVLEAISHPFLKRVELAEYEKFGVTPPSECRPELNNDNLAFFKEEALLADLVLAASPYVRDGLIELGLDSARCAVVPYGLDSEFYEKPQTPEPGRVLYVGNIGYLKGVPYLAEAARRLRAEAFPGEIRAVGFHDGGLTHRPEFIGPKYVGQIPRAEVKQEFLNADVFVFPTLSDGFGIVLLEAMAAGLPVICTPNCASVVRNGESGYVVPVRDAGALAIGIREIVTNRSVREAFSKEARRQVANFSLERYGARLLTALGAAR